MKKRQKTFFRASSVGVCILYKGVPFKEIAHSVKRSERMTQQSIKSNAVVIHQRRPRIITKAEGFDASDRYRVMTRLTVWLKLKALLTEAFKPP